MGRLSKTFCWCFGGSSTYEIAPETDDFDTVIIKNNNRNLDDNDLTEKLLHTQNQKPIEIKKKILNKIPESDKFSLENFENSYNSDIKTNNVLKEDDDNNDEDLKIKFNLKK